MDKRHNAASEQTERELASALKTLMAQKPIEKITIRELTEMSGIRRQNFYYHFDDIYDLMCRMFREEALSLIREREGEQLWQDGLLQLFRYIEDNRAVCLCARSSLGRDSLKDFFKMDIYAVIHDAVEKIGADIGVFKTPGGTADVELMTQYYVVAAVGMVESWLIGELKQTPDEIVAFLDQTINDHIRGAFLRLHSGK